MTHDPASVTQKKRKKKKSGNQIVVVVFLPFNLYFYTAILRYFICDCMFKTKISHVTLCKYRIYCHSTNTHESLMQPPIRVFDLPLYQPLTEKSNKKVGDDPRSLA